MYSISIRHGKIPVRVVYSCYIIRPKTQINVFSYARQRIPCLILAFCTYLYDATENVTEDVLLGHNRFSLITFDQIKLESGKAPLWLQWASKSIDMQPDLVRTVSWGDLTSRPLCQSWLWPLPNKKYPQHLTQLERNTIMPKFLLYGHLFAKLFAKNKNPTLG